MANSACGFETFEHAADIGIRAWGKEPIELFVEAARALFSVIADISTSNPKEEVDVVLEASDEEGLLLAWLKKLLFIFNTKHLLLSEFRINQLNKNRIVAKVYGEHLDQTKHVLDNEVKTIAHHQFKFVKEKSRYLCEAILDI